MCVREGVRDGFERDIEIGPFLGHFERIFKKGHHFGVRVGGEEREEVGVIFIFKVDFEGEGIVLIEHVDILFFPNFRPIHVGPSTFAPAIPGGFLFLQREPAWFQALFDETQVFSKVHN